jgi:DNA primase
MDKRGRVVAFGGRVFRSADQTPKYLNSPDTPLFDKGRILFNHHRALLNGGSDIIVVEGYMDVIGLFQAGFSNVTAPLGTGFTHEQVRLLEKNFRRIYLVFDGDSAGSQATFRAIERFMDSGLIVRSVCLPDKMDPQEFVGKRGREAFQAELDNAKDALRFYCEQIFLRHPLDEIRSKRQAYAALLEFFRKMNPLFLQGDEGVNQSELIEFLENSFQVSEKIIREQFFAGLIIRDDKRIETTDMGSEPCSPKIELGIRLMLRISANNEFRDFFLTKIKKDFLGEALLEEVYSFLESGQPLLPVELLLPHASVELSHYLSGLNWGEDVIGPLHEKVEFLHFLRDFGIQLFQEKIDSLSRSLYAGNYTNEDEKKLIFQKREQFRTKKTEWMKKFSASGLEIL